MRGVVLALLALLGWLAPSPAAALAVLRGLSSALAGPADVATVLVALVALAGWGLLAWLAVIAGLQVLSVVPGGTGRVASAIASTLAPIGVRRGLAVLLGLSLATTAPATAWAAGAVTPTAAAASAAADLPDLDWPAVRALPGPAVPAPSPGSSHVVTPGESLWSIAAGRLGPQATTADVAAAWPRWWQANRADIGADPDLLHPGTRLIPPTPSLESEQP